MNAKAKKLLNDLHADLELLGFPDLAARVTQVQKELTPAPKKAKAPEAANFKVIVTEGSKVYEVLLAEKDLDKWLMLQAKNRRAAMAQFFKDNSMYIPNAQILRSQEYKDAMTDHKGIINEAGRNYSLLIQRL